jgi:hypothetical protein
MSMYISSFTATIPVNYTSEFQEILAAIAYNTVHAVCIPVN